MKLSVLFVGLFGLIALCHVPSTKAGWEPIDDASSGSMDYDWEDYEDDDDYEDYSSSSDHDDEDDYSTSSDDDENDYSSSSDDDDDDEDDYSSSSNDDDEEEDYSASSSEDEDDLEKIGDTLASGETSSTDEDSKSKKKLHDRKSSATKSSKHAKSSGPSKPRKNGKLPGLKEKNDKKLQTERRKDFGQFHCIAICDDAENGCTCQPEAETVDCANAKLDSATLCIGRKANTALKRVSELVLKENNIHEIETNSFLVHRNLAELVEIDLSHNQIRHIESGAFKDMTNLNLLDLKFNEIHHIDKDTFKGLKKLLDIDLRANKIYKLDEESFEDLESLVQLFLDYNFLHHIDDDAFEGLKKLEHLSLGHTGLKTIRPEWFKDLVSLKSLNIQFNQIQTMPGFVGMPNLERLIFSGNGVTKLRRNSFRRLPKLQELHLSRMTNLTEIEECTFCNLPKLSTISLSDCPNLFLFDRYAFGVGPSRLLKGLKQFDMQNSSLRTLSQDLLPWDNITAANLKDNRWNCDCDITWVLKLRLHLQSDAMCHSPKELAGRLLTTLHHDELHCSLSMGHAAKIFVAILIMVLVAGSLAFVWYLYYGNFNGPKNRVTKIFQTRNPLPPYAYRNLAMSAETDEVKLVNEQKMEDKDEDTLYPPPATV